MGTEVLLYVLGLVLLLFAGRLLKKPLIALLRLLLHSLLGGAVLVLINTFGGAWGIQIGVNPITALVCGLFGVPGILLLLILRQIFG